MELGDLINSKEKFCMNNICLVSVASIRNLTKSLVHSGEKPHVCNICHKSFSQKGNLQTHTLIHSGKKPHVCNICQKSFIQKEHLKNHSLIHSGEKPHVCNICHKSFTQRGNLQTHSLIHSGEKAHICNICHKSFTLKSNLKSHSLIHTGEKPHVCNICHKAFPLKRTLKNHSLIHTGEKPHVCNVCHKAFNLKRNLKCHSLIHSRKTPHVCNICQKSVIKQIYLKKMDISVGNGKTFYACESCYKVASHEKIPLLYNNEKDYLVSDDIKMDTFNSSVAGRSFLSNDLTENGHIKEENNGIIVKEEHDLDYKDMIYHHNTEFDPENNEKHMYNVKEEKNLYYEEKIDDFVEKKIYDDIVKEENDIDD